VSVPVTLEGGEGGRGEAFDGEVLACVFERALPPGAPVGIRLDLGERERELSLRGKSLGSRRRPDGTFGVRLRLLSLRRAEREALRSALPG